jgi:hypothetical protein
MAYPVRERTRRAFLVEFLEALQDPGREPTGSAVAAAAAMARRACMQKRGIAPAELYSWQVWSTE